MERVSSIALYHHSVKFEESSIYTIKIDKTDSDDPFFFKCYIDISSEDSSTRDGKITFEFGAYKINKEKAPYATLELNSIDVAKKLKEATIERLAKNRSFFRFGNSYSMLCAERNNIEAAIKASKEEKK